MPDLYDLAHVAGWEPNNLHGLEHISCVSDLVLHRSCTTHLTTAGWDLNNLDRDLSEVFTIFLRRVPCPRD